MELLITMATVRLYGKRIHTQELVCVISAWCIALLPPGNGGGVLRSSRRKTKRSVDMLDGLECIITQLEPESKEDSDDDAPCARFAMIFTSPPLALHT